MKTVLKNLALAILSLPLIAVVFLLSPFIDIIAKEEQDVNSK